jgi:uncharacterized protein YydD (DUF2326 family)
MKLSRLYCNRAELFGPIQFREGLNVVVADIRHPKEDDNFGHNLGKTLLIEVIDFGLLGGVDKDHFFKRHPELFADLVIYLEVRLPAGDFVTIRRSAAETSKIAFKRHSEAGKDFTVLPEDDWDHWRESFKKATNLLDSYLAFSSIKPWPYRKGVGYFLRGQGDWGDVFQLSKFGAGKHIHWKPYVGRVLGFDDNILTAKYQADKKYQDLNNKRSELQAEVSFKPADFDKIRASIAAKRDEIDVKLRALDAFDFHAEEVGMVRSVVEKIEAEIAEVNHLLYNARHDLAQIERHLADEIHFDLSDVQRIFSEAQITFPAQLTRDYNDLVVFNRRILTERRANLAQRASELKSEIATAEAASATLGAKRSEILRVLGGSDSLQKFKDLQKQLDDDRATIAIMETKAAKLQELVSIHNELRATKTEVDQLTTRISEMVSQGSSRYTSIQRVFSRIISDVLHRTALLYLTQNGEGNLDPHAEFSDADTELETDEARGTTFRQLLCIAFDLAVLISYANEPFFHFVYHDGALERVQIKLKLALLQTIRQTCRDHGIQYILTTLSEDIPLNEKGAPSISKDEIILELHDGGEDGRLFRMPTF